MTMDKDTRGWILTAISGIACFLGSTIICVDILVRRFPRMHNFKITESDAFLSASLSLSAGMFSSLYSMLPASKNYLTSGGFSPKAASFMLIGLFLAGVFGIRILSQIMHRFIPSHVVDCDHTHDEEEGVKRDHGEMSEHDQDKTHEQSNEDDTASKSAFHGNHVEETTPLLSGSSNRRLPPRTTTAPVGSVSETSQTNGHTTAPNSRKTAPIFPRSLSRTFSKYVSSKKDACDENGPCMGFSDPCGQDCFRIVQRRGSLTHTQSLNRLPTRQKVPGQRPSLETPVPEESIDTSDIDTESCSGQRSGSQCSQKGSQRLKPGPRSRSATHHYHHPEHEHEHEHSHKASSRRHSTSHHHQPNHAHNHGGATDHHHHVPTNAFMSIGLQTSIAIALHKAPEGFITFATNHANPKLGFTVFVALFIHNITEGFALALPLFLALNSRFKAILWASILGGLSQPFGAGIAALWFKVSRSSGHLAPNEKIYGGIFAVTAGIMASVALSLLSESLQLSHNKNTCVTFAFVGMGILGISMALTAS